MLHNHIFIDVLGIVIIYVTIGLWVIVISQMVDLYYMITDYKRYKLTHPTNNSLSEIFIQFKTDTIFAVMCIFAWPFVVWFYFNKRIHWNK